MNETILQELKELCGNIKSCCATAAQEWQWDGRFNTAMASFDVKAARQLFEGLSGIFTARWDAATIKQSPRQLHKFVKSSFGVQANQFLFTTGPESPVVLVAAWWPWSNGETISLRIGMYNLVTNSPAGEELAAVVRDCFCTG